MNYKNRKRDYDLYPTVEFDDVRHMLKCTAEKYGERTAISYRVSPHDAAFVFAGCGTAEFARLPRLYPLAGNRIDLQRKCFAKSQ